MLLEKKADSSKTISDFLKYVVYSADSTECACSSMVEP